MTIETHLPIRFLKIAAVKAITGIGQTTIYDKMSRGEFPKNITLNGTRCAVWVESEIYAWTANQLRLARNSSREEPTNV